MRQRVMIAMALLREPELLIADEPTTALDVTTQKEILSLIVGLTRTRGMGLLLITHNLGIANEIADVTYVFYAGRVVEVGPTRTLFERAAHPYTRGLIASIPSLDASRPVSGIPGEISQSDRESTGCCFIRRVQICNRYLRRVPATSFRSRWVTQGGLLSCKELAVTLMIANPFLKLKT